MYANRIAATISEHIGEQPQSLFDRYVESVDLVVFEEFSNYCAASGTIITENVFIGLLENSDEYLFTEGGDGWLPTKLDDLELELGL